MVTDWQPAGREPTVTLDARRAGRPGPDLAVELAGDRPVPAPERHRGALLSETSAALLGSPGPAGCMEITAALAARRLADAALVVTPASPCGFRIVTAMSGQDGPPQESLVEGDGGDVPGLAAALAGLPPTAGRRLDPAALPPWLVPDGIGEVGSGVVTPLPGLGRPAGALVLLRRISSRPFSAAEEATVREFAARSGLALSAARTHGSPSITETLVRDLLPPTLQRVAGVDYAAGYRPAQDSEKVGGDFYDVHPPAGDGAETLAVLGDVCGKGLDAALLTGRIRSALHALLPAAGDHPHLLRRLNEALLDDHPARFVTLVLASVTRCGADVRLRLTCAGHPPPLIVRTDGRVEEAATHGTLIGALPTIEAVTYETWLRPGDSCVLYTDGITEAHGGPLGRDQFGEERLHHAAAGCAGLPAAAVVERIQTLASDWVAGDTHDDMAVLAITAPRDRTGRHDPT